MSKLFFIQGLRKILQMPLQEGRKNGHESLGAREADGKNHKMALQPWVDDKGTAGRIHGCQKLHILDYSQLQLGHVIPVLIVHVLTQ